MLGRNKKEWDNGIKRYYLLIFNSDKIDYTNLDWKETFNKDNEVNTVNNTNQVNKVNVFMKSILIPPLGVCKD